MDTNFTVLGTTLIIEVIGDLDHHCEREIREEADRIFDRELLHNFLFDFSKTGFMDSSGIGVIMGRFKKAASIGGNTAVIGMSSNIDRILKVSGVYKLIKQYQTIEEGLIGLEEQNVAHKAQERSMA